LISRNINSKIYKTIILPVVSYGREALSLTSRERHRVWAIDKEFGIKCLGLRYSTGDCTRLHIEKLRHLYAGSDIIRAIWPRIMRLVEHVACIGEGRGAYRFWLKNVRERDHMCAWGKKISKWILMK
jgi:hypothetical protein